MGKLEAIEEQHDTVRRLREEWEALDQDAKAKKKLLQAAERRRDAVIVIGEDALKEQTALFPEAEANGKEKKPGRKKKDAAEPDAPKDEAWRERPVNDAIAVGVVVNGLETQDPPVLTLGEMADWLKKRRLTDLPGVGEEKAAKASDQLAEFFKANPQYCQ